MLELDAYLNGNGAPGRRPMAAGNAFEVDGEADIRGWRDQLLEEASAFVAEEWRCIVEAIVFNLDGRGWLVESEEQLASEVGVAVAAVTECLAIVQRCGSPGVGARNGAECLQLQLERSGRGGSIAARIVRECAKEVEDRDLSGIAKKLGMARGEVAEAIEELRGLSVEVVGEDYLDPVVRRPVTAEVKVEVADDGEFVVILNERPIPSFRLSAEYRDVLVGEASEAQSYVRSKARAVLALMRNVQQRQCTLRCVAKAIVDEQRAFFERGWAHLRGLELQQVADRAGVHQSTVSRIIGCMPGDEGRGKVVRTAKYMDTPFGMVPMRAFFQPGLPRDDGAVVSRLVVQERLRSMIEDEDREAPLTDGAIAKQIREQDGVSIERVTIAKYRREVGLEAYQERQWK